MMGSGIVFRVLLIGNRYRLEDVGRWVSGRERLGRKSDGWKMMGCRTEGEVLNWREEGGWVVGW